MSFAANKLLDAVTVTGVGSSSTASAEVGQLIKDHTVSVTTTGSPTAVTMDLEGSLDDVTFFSLASHVFTAAEITAGNAMFHVVNKPVRFVQLNLTTLTGGTSPTVTGLHDHFEENT